jgi:phosphohistidine phosphatase
MELVLLRHAKAEEDSAALPDERRELVPKGRKRALAVAKGLEKLLAGGGRVEVWTSPALRSRQTADIIALQLGVSTVREEAAIYAGNLESLIGEWSADDSERTVVVVGHEPYLGIWVRQLTNATVPFKKCSAAGITLTPPDFSAGTLRWFAGAKVLTSLGESKD